MAMVAPRSRKSRPPLAPSSLEELALRYVGRFATSKAKLNGYLRRKLRERGWSGNRDPDLAALCEKLAELGYVDDRAFALACSRSLTGRGYGERRVQQALSLAGIGDEEGVEARDHAAKEAVDAALRFARRRSLGPYATERQDSAKRDKALAAMVRAGHRFALARAVVDLAPGEQPDMESLSENR